VRYKLGPLGAAALVPDGYSPKSVASLNDVLHGHSLFGYSKA
jgi:hypothetical protein